MVGVACGTWGEVGSLFIGVSVRRAICPVMSQQTKIHNIII